MTSDLLQLLYCSRNCISGTPAETAEHVATILASAQANNSRAGVTGGLLFNTVFFAQVLEGPSEQVERIFEQIQRDPRHSDLTVLQSKLVDSRDFPEWSMAFAGTVSEASHPLISASVAAAIANPSIAGKQVLELLRSLVIQEEDWALPVRRAS